MKSIIDYNSYRQFLIDVFESEKAEGKATLAIIGAKFGFSASALKMILKGQRNLSNYSIFRIAQALKFDRPETQYFEALVFHDQADDDGEKLFHAAKLAAIKSEHIDIEKHRISQSTIFAQWYLPALLLYLLEIAPAKCSQNALDAQQLAKTFKVKADEMEQCLKILIESGLLRLDVRHQYIIQADRLGSMTSHKKFVRRVLEEGLRRFEDGFNRSDHFFCVDTLTLNDEEIRCFVDDYKALTERYMSLPSTHNKRVVEIGVQVFPVHPLK